MSSGWNKGMEFLAEKQENAAVQKTKFRPILSPEEEKELFGSFLDGRQKQETSVQENIPLCIWLEGAGCGGEGLALLDIERNYPLGCVFLPMWMASWGSEAYGQLVQVVKSKKPFTLLTSGAVPIGKQEKNIIVSRHQGRAVSARELLVRLIQDARQVVCLGTCACYGGISAFKMAKGDCIPASSLVDSTKLVMLPGCPVEGNHLEMMISQLAEGKPIPVNNQRFPVWWEKETIHQRCPNQGSFEKKDWAHSFEEKGCRYQLGCKGVGTVCPRSQFQPNCVTAGGKCWGCTNRNFPEG